MRLTFKYKLFSMYDRYDVFDENRNILYKIEGFLGMGKRHARRFIIRDPENNYKGEINKRLFSLRPRFDIYVKERSLGCIKKRLKFFTREYDIEYKDWRAEGDLFGIDYKIKGKNGENIAAVSRKFYEMTSTYTIDTMSEDEEDITVVLLFAIAADIKILQNIKGSIYTEKICLNALFFNCCKGSEGQRLHRPFPL